MAIMSPCISSTLVSMTTPALTSGEPFRTSPEYKGTFAGIPTLAVYKDGMLLATTTNELCDAPSHEAALAVCEPFFDKHHTPGISTATVLCALPLSLCRSACKHLCTARCAVGAGNLTLLTFLDHAYHACMHAYIIRDACICNSCQQHNAVELRRAHWSTKWTRFAQCRTVHAKS